VPKTALMHISDIHEYSLPAVDHQTLVSSIVSDMSRYSMAEVPIKKPTLLIVCGDLIRGSTTSLEDIEKQYQEAEAFLDILCNELFNGDRSRVVIVPGNHDISWPNSMESMKKLQSTDQSLVKMLVEPKNKVRWNWADLSFYSIVNLERYNQRLHLFSKFYESFYKNARKYPLSPDDQFDIFEFESEKLLFVGFNSCFYNDHLNRVGMINPQCITNCHNPIRNNKYEKWIKIAVWHHGIHGLPMQNDFMSEHVVQ